jgi:hypothetical protein
VVTACCEAEVTATRWCDLAFFRRCLATVFLAWVVVGLLSACGVAVGLGLTGCALDEPWFDVVEDALEGWTTAGLFAAEW